MSREIKFRVWHKLEKKMHSYLKAKFGKATNITLEGKFRDVEEVTTKTVPNGDPEVMHYTGLKDNKRTLEYPAILRTKSGGNHTVSPEFIISRVIFDPSRI